MFSLLMVAVNRLVITLAPFITSGRPVFPDLFSWDVFKRIAYTGLNRYDAGWYALIAQWGYMNEKSSAFFPLYPMLMRAFSEATGLSFKAVGQAISTVCFILALWLVQILAEKDGIIRFGSKKAESGRWIACIIAFSPVSFYYTICYTESLFLMLTLLFMTAVAGKKWLPAGAAGFFAGLTRNSGVFLAIIFLFEYLRSILPECGGKGIIKHYVISFFRFIRDFKAQYLKRYVSFLWIMLIPAGTILYFAYLYARFGSFTSAFTAVDEFGRSSLAPWKTICLGIQYNYEKITTTDKPYIFNYFLLELLAVLIFIFAAFYLIRRAPLSYHLFMTVSLLLPLCKPAYAGLTDYFVSFPRYTATLFPYFIAMYGIFHRSRKAFIAYLAASACMLIRCVSLWSAGKFIS